MPKRLLVPLLLCILATVWGSSFLLIKLALRGLSPLQLGTLRIVFAAIFLLPLFVMRFREIPNRHGKFLAIGLIGSLIPAIMFSLAQQKISSSMSGILNSLTPAIAFSIGLVFFKKKGSAIQIIGLILGLFGSVLLSLINAEGGIGQINLYVLFVMVATVCYGLNVNLLEAWFKDTHTLVLTPASLIYAAIPSVILLPVADWQPLAMRETYFWSSIWAVALLGIICTSLALILFNKLLQITSALEASLVTYLIPVVAVIIGNITGEELYLLHFIGMLCILLGVFVINIKKTKT